MEPVAYSKLTPKERREVREAYVLAQHGLCYWCDKPLAGEPSLHVTINKINWSLFPKGFINHPIHLQHNHATDMTEGAVHAYCNAYMWQYKGR